MSNNKQSSVEWLGNEITSRITRRNPHDTIIIQTQGEILIELFEQAKAMHKEEIEKAWLNGVDYRDSNGHASTYLEINLGEQPDKFYNETFENK